MAIKIGGIDKHIHLALSRAVLEPQRIPSWSESPRVARYVAAIYIVMLGALLLAFLGSRITANFGAGNIFVGVVDLAFAIPTLLFFVGYARSS